MMDPEERCRLERLCHRLPKSSRLRTAMIHALQGEYFDETLAKAIVAALDEGQSWLGCERAVAADLVPHIPPRHRLSSSAERNLIRILDAGAEDDSSLLCSLWILSFFPFVTPLSPIVQQGRRNRVRALAARSLGEMRSIAAVDALARGLHDASGAARTLGCGAVRRASADALMNILPLLDASHRSRLERETAPNLARALHSASEQFALSILSAFHHIAGGEAVVPVEWCARRSRDLRVRDAAKALLPILVERRCIESAPITLLRPAGSMNMLRPAVDDPSLWLRPAGPTA